MKTPRRTHLRIRFGTALAAALTVGLVLSGCTGAGMGGQGGNDDATKATGPFDWQRYKGQTVDVMLNEHPWTNGLKEHLSEFEKKTGITVNLKTYSEDLYNDKVAQAVRSSSPPDVYMLPMDDFGATQYEAGLMQPLTPLMENTSLTESSYDFADFPAGLVDPGRFPSGDPNAEVYQLPISTEAYILFYNKDLVDKYLGGTVPSTMKDLIAASQKITAEGKGDVFGSVVRGVRSDGIRDTLTGFVLNQWPLDRKIEAPYNVWFDGAWDKPQLTDPSIVKGISDYAALIDAGPTNKFNIDWDSATSLFSQGKAAFFIDASVFGPGFEDASQSSVAGKVGYALMPKGEVDGSTGVWSWGLAMAKQAKHTGAGWTFLQWATGKEMTAQIGTFTGGAPRQSAASDAVYLKAMNPDFVKIVGEAESTARTTAVLRANWKPGVMVIVDATLDIAKGGDPEQVLGKANETMKQTIK